MCNFKKRYLRKGDTVCLKNGTIHIVSFINRRDKDFTVKIHFEHFSDEYKVYPFSFIWGAMTPSGKI